MRRIRRPVTPTAKGLASNPSASARPDMDASDRAPDPSALDKPWRGQDNQAFRRGTSHSSPEAPGPKEMVMTSLIARLWSNDDGQDIAEYAVMLAVILVIVVGTIRLIGSNANTVFSQVASAVQ